MECKLQTFADNVYSVAELPRQCNNQFSFKPLYLNSPPNFIPSTCQKSQYQLKAKIWADMGCLGPQIVGGIGWRGWYQRRVRLGA